MFNQQKIMLKNHANNRWQQSLQIVVVGLLGGVILTTSPAFPNSLKIGEAPTVAAKTVTLFSGVTKAQRTATQKADTAVNTTLTQAAAMTKKTAIKSAIDRDDTALTHDLAMATTAVNAIKSSDKTTKAIKTAYTAMLITVKTPTVSHLKTARTAMRHLPKTLATHVIKTDEAGLIQVVAHQTGQAVKAVTKASAVSATKVVVRDQHKKATKKKAKKVDKVLVAAAKKAKKAYYKNIKWVSKNHKFVTKFANGGDPSYNGQKVVAYKTVKLDGKSYKVGLQRDGTSAEEQSDWWNNHWSNKFVLARTLVDQERLVSGEMGALPYGYRGELLKPKKGQSYDDWLGDLSQGMTSDIGSHWVSKTIG